jgi:hypothetical protein
MIRCLLRNRDIESVYCMYTIWSFLYIPCRALKVSIAQELYHNAFSSIQLSQRRILMHLTLCVHLQSLNLHLQLVQPLLQLLRYLIFKLLYPSILPDYPLQFIHCQALIC